MILMQMGGYTDATHQNHLFNSWGTLEHNYQITGMVSWLVSGKIRTRLHTLLLLIQCF